ncbi:MAG: hypothetical protein N2Z82_07420 [Thermomicrobium sp.]|nr:hypothetical protein [Thermomicrobium sp.]
MADASRQWDTEPSGEVRRYVLAPMRSSDVPEVSQLERRCFTNPWPESAYYRELREPDRNYYIVLRWQASTVEAEPEPVVAGGPLARIFRPARPRPNPHPVVGFAGIWVIYG